MSIMTFALKKPKPTQPQATSTVNVASLYAKGKIIVGDEASSSVEGASNVRHPLRDVILNQPEFSFLLSLYRAQTNLGRFFALEKIRISTSENKCSAE